jgi:hypothetical protein
MPPVRQPFCTYLTSNRQPLDKYPAALSHFFPQFDRFSAADSRVAGQFGSFSVPSVNIRQLSMTSHYSTNSANVSKFDKIYSATFHLVRNYGFNSGIAILISFKN